MYFICFFFFFKQKTAYEMRISDWSSDVCSSDLQAIAIALREALESPEKTAALVTPDRALATRVSAHLKRWGIEADDSAGRPLSELPAGTLLVALAEAAAERFAPVALLALLKHPLVKAGDERLPWLEQVRRFDLLLRGPRPPAGLAGIDQLIALRRNPLPQKEGGGGLSVWWAEVRVILAPLEAAIVQGIPLPGQLAALREAAGVLTGDKVWAGHQGHQAAATFAEMEAAAGEVPRARKSTRLNSSH